MTIITRQRGKGHKLATINKSFPSRERYVSTPYLEDPAPPWWVPVFPFRGSAALRPKD
ncbi:hypothetical protein ACSS6W_006827 [Trichoderma asperelloides]